MNGKRKTISLDTEYYERERDGDEDPHLVEEKQWLTKESCSSYQISSKPINDVFPTQAYRIVLFDWMREVALQWQFNALTWYLACNYVDRYILSKHAIKLCKKDYQLLGVTCLWIAGKLEETATIDIDDVVTICDNSYSAHQICTMEYSIIEVLHADFRPPTIYAWMEHYKPVSLQDRTLQFVLHCIQLDPEFASSAASEIARILLQEEEKHPLFNRVKHYRKVYKQNKTTLNYDETSGLYANHKCELWQAWVTVK